ncbi:MAG: hypothetical protein HQ567_10435 [Candidatus Nealsonbacteria bacterium]|nr:hypothetical protein [Candidatus Nealsonbacteria bacterium]
MQTTHLRNRATGSRRVSAVLLVCCWAGVALVGVALADGEMIAPDLPVRGDWQQGPSRPPQIRHWQWGWEVQTQRYSVFCTTNRSDALWAARQMERAWSDYVRLTDLWTDVTRRPQFKTAALRVLITDRPLKVRVPGGGGVSTGNGQAAVDYGPDVYVGLQAADGPLPNRLGQMRREAFRRFLRMTGQDRTLPPWVQTGLAARFAEQSPDGHVAGGADGGKEPQAVLQVRYLLIGNDARHAPDFLAALAATDIERPVDPSSPTVWNRDVLRGSRDTPPRGTTELDRLLHSSAVRQGLAVWLADPQAGQPVVLPQPDIELTKETLDEMALILKLARRFHRPAEPSIRYRAYQFNGNRADPVRPQAGAMTPEQERPWDLAALYRRLIDQRTPRWATVDTDGSLLLCDNRRRLAEIFANPQRPYQAHRQDGHAVLETVADSGQTYLAWLEDRPEIPGRPIVRVQRKDELRQ